MKVELNLAFVPTHRERYALAWALPLFVAGVVALAFFIPLAVHNLREYSKLGREVNRLQNEKARVASQERELREKLNRPASRRIVDEADYVNGLIEAKQLSVTGLAVRVSRLMPDTVRLKGMSLSFQNNVPRVRFAVTGKDESSVEDFLARLEDSPDFQDVAIVNEGFETNGVEEPISVMLTARYMAGASLETGKQ